MIKERLYRTEIVTAQGTHKLSARPSAARSRVVARFPGDALHVRHPGIVIEEQEEEDADVTDIIGGRRHFESAVPTVRQAPSRNLGGFTQEAEGAGGLTVSTSCGSGAG
jgi:hypothetical protein